MDKPINSVVARPFRPNKKVLLLVDTFFFLQIHQKCKILMHFFRYHLEAKNDGKLPFYAYQPTPPTTGSMENSIFFITPSRGCDNQ